VVSSQETKSKCKTNKTEAWMCESDMPLDWKGFCRGGGCIVLTQTIYAGHVEAIAKTKLIPELEFARNMYKLQSEDAYKREGRMAVYAEGLAIELGVARKELAEPSTNWVHVSMAIVVGVLIGGGFGLGVAL